MSLDEFTVMLDEYVVVDPVDGFCYFWSNAAVNPKIGTKIRPINARAII